MKDFKSIWKQLASSKSVKAKDMFAYSILRAMAAKSESKKEIAKYFVARSFPKKKTQTDWLAAKHAHHELSGDLRWSGKIIGVPVEEIFSSEEELLMFKDILETFTFDFDRVYTYVFVRQDLSPEYQLVQAAHATMVLGQRMPSEFNPRETYFTVIGVADKSELKAVQNVLDDNGFKYEDFIEPDIGNEVTAIATHPVHWLSRRPLKSYKLLTFSSPVVENVYI